jgi:beta-mannosidase
MAKRMIALFSAAVAALLGIFLSPSSAGLRDGSAQTAVLQYSLGGEWAFSPAGKASWNKARVPGCVHTDLMAAGLIPDPFYRDNETKVRWVEEEDWIYRRTFDVPEALLGQAHVELVAEGLDTFARILVNGRPAGEADNMFRTFRFDVKPFLRKGANEIRVEFDSPVKREKALESKLSYKLPGNAPHVRKAPYHFGWDWGPRLATSGIWRPLYLEAWTGARIADLQVTQEFLGPKTVLLHVRADVLSDIEGPAELNVRLGGAGTATGGRPLTLVKGPNEIETSLRVENARLWWPAGMGAQDLYDVRVTLLAAGGAMDAASRRIGLRTLVLEQKPDRWGRSFDFVVNGVPFFAKGANWIPADSFPSRVDRTKYERLLRASVEANMNMLRVWGGGIYESPDFYDLCDELGLVVWQDFMFACQMVPGDEGFRGNVAREAADVILRLRHHPSLALWCGNNECEEGWFFWGWKESLPASVWNDYEAVFEGLLPEAVKAYDPGRAYWPSSPHSEKTGDPRSERSGDMHYWGVWHGQEPFSEYRKKFHRFFSEFGFQSFPLLETVRTFTVPGDWNLTSPVMELHQKHPEGNRLILQYMLDDYRMPKDFESTLWLSQVLQAEGMKTAVEHFRSQRPRTMGALYWQLEDCWPVASWSGIDSTGAWKALHYYARRFFSPVLVAPIERQGRLEVSCVSDLLRTRSGAFEWSVTAYDGSKVDGGSFTVKIEPLASKVILSRPVEKLVAGRPPESVYFACELRDGREVLSSNVFHFAKLKKTDLPAPAIAARATAEGGSLVVTLVAGRFAKDVYLSAPGVPGRFADNFFDLLPGRPRRVLFLPGGAVQAAGLEKALSVRSLRDSY